MSAIGRGVGVDDRVQHLDRVAAAERGHAGDHLVEHDAEAEDVGAVVGGLARRLLRGAVAHRAVGHADLGQGIVGPRRRRVPPVSRVVRHEHLGEAEVEDPRLAAGPDDDVGGLEVAVHDPARVGHREGVGELDRDRERGERLERPPAHELLEGRPLHVLQHDVVEAVRLPDVVDALDVRVVEGGAQGRLALEAPPRGLARGELRLQGLDHDGAAEPQVLGLEGGRLASRGPACRRCGSARTCCRGRGSSSWARAIVEPRQPDPSSCIAARGSRGAVCLDSG